MFKNVLHIFLVYDTMSKLLMDNKDYFVSLSLANI